MWLKKEGLRIAMVGMHFININKILLKARAFLMALLVSSKRRAAAIHGTLP